MRTKLPWRKITEEVNRLQKIRDVNVEGPYRTEYLQFIYKHFSKNPLRDLVIRVVEKYKKS
jgi:hypothetical protein